MDYCSTGFYPERDDVDLQHYLEGLEAGGHRRCKVDILLGSLTPQAGDALNRVLDNPKISTRSIMKAIQDADDASLFVGREAITKHRERNCSCFKKETE